MLQALIGISLRQRLLVLVATVGLVVAGWLSFKDLPIDAFPDVSTTQVKIIFKAPGMTPEILYKFMSLKHFLLCLGGSWYELRCELRRELQMRAEALMATTTAAVAQRSGGTTQLWLGRLCLPDESVRTS